MSAKTGISAAPSSPLTEGREVTTHLLLRSLADRIERRSCGDDGGDAPLQPLGARRTISAPIPAASPAPSFGRGGKSPLHCRRTDMSDRPVSSFRRHQGAAAEAALSGDDSFNDGGSFVSRTGTLQEFASALDFAKPPPPPTGARRWCARARDTPAVYAATFWDVLVSVASLAAAVLGPLHAAASVSLRADEWPAALRHPALVSLSALLFVLHVALNFRTAISSKGALESPPAAIALAYARSRALCGSISPSSAPSSARRGATRARRSRCCSRRGTCSCSRRSSRRRQRWSRARCGWV